MLNFLLYEMFQLNRSVSKDYYGLHVLDKSSVHMLIPNS